jgi:hypothetical protein
MVRLTRALIPFVALLGVLYAAARFPPARWRAGLLYQKVSGALPGVGWRELGARVAPESLGLQAWIGPGPGHFVQKLDYPIHLNENWKLYSIFAGRSGCLSVLDVHFSVLEAGEIPHQLHQHGAEEVLIPVSSEAEILRAGDVNSTGPEVVRIGPGQFVYHPSGQAHTIRGVAPGPSTYLVLRCGEWSYSACPRCAARFDLRLQRGPAGQRARRGVRDDAAFRVADLASG